MECQNVDSDTATVELMALVSEKSYLSHLFLSNRRLFWLSKPPVSKFLLLKNVDRGKRKNG